MTTDARLTMRINMQQRNLDAHVAELRAALGSAQRFITSIDPEVAPLGDVLGFAVSLRSDAARLERLASSVRAAQSSLDMLHEIAD